MKLLNLLRKRRQFEYRTIDGHKTSNHLIHSLLSREIEIEMQTIGGQNKTKLTKEAKNNPFLTQKIKRGECPMCELVL